MDPPPYLHHPRYAPAPPRPPPPPPPPPQIPDNHNFYRSHTPNNHHSNRLQQPQQLLPPPPPPPLQQQQFHLLPGPPQQQQQQQQNPYNPHQPQPQFNFNPMEDNHNPRSHHQILNFPLSPRISHRSLFNENHHHRPSPPHHNHNHRLPEFVWPDLRDPSRPVNLDHRQFDHHQRPVSPPPQPQPQSSYRSIDKFRQELIREELLRSRGGGGGGGGNGGDDDNSNYHHQQHHRRIHFGSDSDRSSREIGTVSNHGSFTRGFESNSSNFDNRYGSKFDGELIRNNSESQRWSHTNRDILRDPRDSMIEIRNDEIGDSNGVRVLSAKREYYGLDLGRYNNNNNNNRGSREGSHEYNRTPRKQIQKKSALLRIQRAKPSSYRNNREDERSHFSGYLDESKSSGFGGKDQILEEEEEVVERERSPVGYLDVSFKSNSLVAKAILTTPSSSRVGVVSDVNLTPRNSKVRKVLMSSDKECSISQVSKVDEGSVRLDSSVHVVNNVSSSDKDLKRSGEKVTGSGIGNLGDGSSQQCSNGTKVSIVKRKVEGASKGTVSNKGGSNLGSGTKGTVSDKGGSNLGSGAKVTTKNTVSNKGGSIVGSGDTSSVKDVKKKKVVKRVVRKVINPRSQLSSSQPTKKHDEPLKADSSACSLLAPTESDKGVTPFEEKIATAGITPVSGVDSQPCPNEINMSAENDKVDGSPQTMVSGAVGSDVDSGGSCVPKINRKRKKLSSPLGSFSLEEIKSDVGFVNPDNTVHSFHTISNTGKDLTKSLNETTVSVVGSVDDVSKQCCENGDSILRKNVGATESLEVLLSVGGNSNSGMLSSEENKLVNTCSFTHSMNTVTDSDLMNLQDSFTVSDIGTVDSVSKQPCRNQAGSSVESDNAEEFSNALSLVGSSGNIALSSLDETRVYNSPIYADGSNRGRGIMLGTDNVCAHLEKVNCGTGDDIGKHPSPDGVTISLQNGALDGSTNTMVLVGGIGEDTPNNKNKRKIRTSQLDLSSSMTTDMCLGSVDIVSSAQCVDTTLSISAKDPCFSEGRDSGFGNLYVGLCPSVDEVSVLDGSSSEMKVSVSSVVNVGLNETSPQNKRRKVSASHSGLSSPTGSVINEGPVIADISTSGVELQANSKDALVQPEEEVTVCSMDTLCPAGLLPCPERISASLENSSAGGSFEAVGSARDAYMDDGLKTDMPVVDSCSALGESAIQSELSLCPLVGEQMARATPVTVGNKHQNDVTDMDNSNREKMDVDAAEEQVMIPSKTAKHRIPSEHQSPDVDDRLPGSDVEYDGCLVEKDGFPSVSNYLALSGDGDGVLTTNINDERMEFVPDTLSDMGSPETLSGANGIHTLNCKASLSQISHEKVCGNDTIPDEKIVIEGGSNLSAHTSDSQTTKINLKFDHAVESDHSLPKNTGPLASQHSKTTTHTLNPMSGEINGRKNQRSHTVPKVYPSRSSFTFTASKNTVSSSSTAKARTWHRTGNSSASTLPGNQAISSTVHAQRPLPKKVTKFQNTSYVRKGNSLVRKAAPVAALPQGSHTSSSVFRSNSLGVDEVKKSSGDVTEQPTFLRTGVIGSFERPRTPPLTSVTKVPNRATNFSGDCTTSPLAEPHPNGSCETTSDPMKVSETNDVPNPSEDAVKIYEIPVNQIGSGSNLESRSELNHGNLASSNAKRITYVKRKSNQLIATSNLSGLSVHNANKNNSESYYKRSKNQLIRTSLESQVKQTVTMPDDASNSEGQTASKLISSRSFSKKRSHKVVLKNRKPSKFSLVWTLRSTQLSRDDGDSLHHQVLPHLVPWKRATYWRSFMQNLASMSNSNSLSTISRKLLLLRKRDTVYTRSAHGFSLRKSKVWSVGGSNLKWSKSIERNSKKANEEATLAVAAAQRKKREQNSAGCIVSGTKNRNHSSRERIFRIGSVRYKMDSSRRTLQRISDDESSCSATFPSENNAKKSYVPRRLVIGTDEYVRIGNGNQLIRDPKKRTRVLASEKVRWSLHTARLRLARKRKYCQFFTRFGKCNKDDGKCPYIHDPSKIAVCTKFLNGLCSNPSCKLTHQVIPERMPDCSYFLQGLCTNKNCPYRHVHVNPNASTCEGFLRGYCADGNECRKKHSYVCPIFEATGSCPQGSKCKLHHPKNRSKGKKRKRSREQNAQGRYFGSMHVNISEPGTAVLEKHSVLANGDIFFEGRISDFIGLDVSDEEAGESNDPTSEHTSICDSDPSDVQLDDLDELIKPIRIMHMNLMT